MTKTTVFEPLLEENFQQLTTPNYQVFQTVAAARLGAWDSTKSDSSVCYVEEKEAFYNFCSTCGLPDDGDLILTTSAGGTSRWEMVQKVSRTQGDNGWIDRDGLTVSKLNTTTVRATLTSNAYYAINSKRITLSAGNYDISFTGSARTIAVYFDANGALAQSNSVPGALFTNTPLCVVYWTGTAIGGIQTEFHGIRDAVWHAWAHKYLGTQYNDGLSITTNTQADNNTDPNDDTVQYLWLTTGTIYDEDTAVTIGTGNWTQTLGSGLTSATAASIPFFYYSAAASAVIGVAANADRYPFLYTGANGYPEWENAGVRTAAVNGDYVVYHYFASPFIDGYSVFARPHNAKFSTLIAAQAARPSSLTWSAIGEFKHIYSVVLRCGSWSPVPAHNCKIVSVQDFRLVSSGPASGVNASAHSALSGLSDPNAHPATSIAADTTNFGGELSTSETNVQLALDRIDDYDSLLDWATGKAYRVGNVVRITTEGFIGEWRCVTAHTAAVAVTTDINSGYWEIVANSEGSRELINAASHGFASGTPLARVGGVWVAAHCMDEAYAEVQAIVAGVTTNYFVAVKTGKLTITGGAWPLEGGNGALVDNTTYWLAATPGKITATKPTTVGYIEKPLLNSAGTTSGNTTLQMRGTTVGGTNLYTTIPLNNGGTTNLQTINVAAGEGGFIEGVIKIDATTDYVTTFKVEFARPITGTTYTCTPTYGCDALPSGSSIDITTGGVIQLTLPAISGFSSGSAKFCMQAAANGTTLPIQVPSSQITWSEPTMFRNRIINGNFDIWQRGTTPGTLANEGAGAGLYVSADRWKLTGFSSGVTYISASLTQITSSLPTGSRYAAKLASTLASNDSIVVAQIIESVNSFQMVGQRATVSLKIKKLAGYNAASPIVVGLYRLSATDTPPTLLSPITGPTLLQSYSHTPATTDWETVSFTTTNVLPAEAAYGLMLSISYDKTDMGAADMFAIAQVQLEPGTVATPFEFRPYGTELALCQRYCYVVNKNQASNYMLGLGLAFSSTQVALVLRLPVESRVPFTLTVPSVVGNWYIAANGAARIVTSIGQGANMTSTDSVEIELTSTAAAMTAQNSYSIHQNAFTGTLMRFEAEL